jgi:hypothetical protein
MKLHRMKFCYSCRYGLELHDFDVAEATVISNLYLLEIQVSGGLVTLPVDIHRFMTGSSVRDLKAFASLEG